MNISCISDVHITRTGDAASELFLTFINNKKVQESDKVILLGDIFDMLVGSYNEYASVFSREFKALSELSKKTEVIYLEGNHDFFISDLMTKNTQIKVCTEPFIELWSGKKVLFCHGDEIEIDNKGYHFYRSMVKSSFVGSLLKIIPFTALNKIGQTMSKHSLGGEKYCHDEEFNSRVREKFRRSMAVALEEYQADIVICGHSHVQDKYAWDNKLGVNNGFALQSKTFAYLSEDNEITFQCIE